MSKDLEKWCPFTSFKLIEIHCIFNPITTRKIILLKIYTFGKFYPIKENGPLTLTTTTNSTMTFSNFLEDKKKINFKQKVLRQIYRNFCHSSIKKNDFFFSFSPFFKLRVA